MKKSLQLNSFLCFIKTGLLIKPLPTCGSVIMVLIAGMLSIASCKKRNQYYSGEADTSNKNYKGRPAKISYGVNTFNISYNTLGKPDQIVNYILPSSEGAYPTKVTYNLEYNSLGQVRKLARYINTKLEHYYLFDYNAHNQIIRQTDYNDQNKSESYSTAEYLENGNLIKVISHIQGSSTEITCDYKYENDNLIKKAVTNMFNPATKEFYNADFIYEYYLDKGKKTKIFFDGLLGLRFISDYVDSRTMFYLPDSKKPQLLFAQEASGGRNMLKSIHVDLHHFIADNTYIDFSYEYDKKGFAKVEKAETKRVMVRSELIPFGIPVTVLNATYIATSTTPINGEQ